MDLRDLEPLDARSISLEPPAGTRIVCFETVPKLDHDQRQKVQSAINLAICDTIQHQEVDVDDENPDTIRVQADMVSMPTWRYRDEIARAYDAGCLAAGRGLAYQTPEEMAGDEAGAVARNIARFLATSGFSDDVREILYGILCKLAEGQKVRLERATEQLLREVSRRVNAIHALTQDFAVSIEDAGLRLLQLDTLGEGVKKLNDAATSGDLEQVKVALYSLANNLSTCCAERWNATSDAQGAE
jgi:hypothetical protein